MTTLKPVRLTHLKTQASFLLKELHYSRDSNVSSRFLQLSIFSGKSSSWIIENIEAIKLKHAFEVIALENGFSNWATLKNFVVEKDCLYRSGHVGLIYAWFDDYQKAENYLLKHGGYLITFWKDYIVCGDEYIDCLDLLIYKDHWRRIGFNWAKPVDYDSWKFLYTQAKENYIKLK